MELHSRSLGAVTLAVLFAFPPTPVSGQEVPGPTLLPEHEFLESLVGEWTVVADGRPAGQAFGRARLQGQFIEIRIGTDSGPVRSALYTFGFDARHGRFSVVAMDNTGTYWVTAQGARDGDTVTMFGVDDDPVLADMGIEKEFVIELTLVTPDSVRIETRLIDNRTPQRTELPFFGFDLRRDGGGA